jgi:hypothetical protein
MDIDEEVLDDPVDRYIVDIQFVPFDEEEQEVERAFKLW